MNDLTNEQLEKFKNNEDYYLLNKYINAFGSAATKFLSNIQFPIIPTNDLTPLNYAILDITEIEKILINISNDNISIFKSFLLKRTLNQKLNYLNQYYYDLKKELYDYDNLLVKIEKHTKQIKQPISLIKSLKKRSSDRITSKLNEKEKELLISLNLLNQYELTLSLLIKNINYVLVLITYIRKLTENKKITLDKVKEIKNKLIDIKTKDINCNQS